MAVSSPSFTFEQPSGSNLPDASSNDSDVVAVVAGPAYASLSINATSGLGATANVRIKLVAAGTAAADCSTSTAQAGAPLDGSGAPSAYATTVNTFDSVSFSLGGQFQVCYQEDNTVDSWELLSVTVNVAGSTSAALHTFCFADTSYPCRFQLPGFDLGATYTVGLVAASGSCGSSSLETSAFNHSASQVVAAESNTTTQVHSLGPTQSVVANTYVLCLCPDFDADDSGSTCQTDSPADFVQTLGKLFVTVVTPSVTNVYNGLAFDLTVECGATEGGCSASSDSRIKIVDEAADNDADMWNASGGCGVAVETARQVSPVNCQSSSVCWDAPVSAAALSLTWEGLLFEGRQENRRFDATYYDVCFCEGSCSDRSSWLKVGELQVKPVSILGDFVANVAADVQLVGASGSWTQNGTSGVREMKILTDTHFAATRDECFELSQSTLLVSGHECNSMTDCSEPTYNSWGQTYSDVVIHVPGWTAVCYCDTSCEDRQQWFVLGRIETAGPISGQEWSFYTGIVVDMSVQGWKLSTDNRITILSYTQQCSESSTSNSAVTGPSPAAPTQLSGSAGDLASFQASGDLTEVTFSAAHGLESGARIIIAGVTCSSCTEQVKGMFNNEHEVLNATSSTSVTINVTFSEYPTMDASAGEWRRADLQTYAGLVVAEAGRYSVCWRSTALADQSKSFLAGSLLITDPPTMPAQLYLSAIEPFRVAPVVIVFTTSTNQRYQDATGPMQLRISFVNTDMLEPYFYDESRVLTVDTSRDSFDEAAQSTCGQFFLELGTDSTLGFPMPQGCYYKQEGDGWEFYMVFHEGNGLAPAMTYEVVMNARVLADHSGEVLQVWSLDDAVIKRYDVVELGRANASKHAATMLRQATDPSFHLTSGVTLLGGSDGILELSGSTASFDMQLQAASGAPIKAGNLVRFFLRPFTQWHVGSACSASCTPQTGSTCGSVTECFTESLMGDWKQQNVMKIVLPSTMDDITDSVKHTVSFTALTVPAGGFFPTPWLVELQADEGTKPHYITVTGNLVYVQPTVTMASLVTTPGDGNPRPFRGDVSNELYLKLVLGSTVFAASAGDALLTIGLPTGYSNPSIGAAPDVLHALGSAVPSGRGDFTYGGSEGTWAEVSSSQYQFTFGAQKAFYAGSSVFLSMSLDNPSDALEQGSAENLWTLQLSAKGSHVSNMELSPALFTGTNGFSGSTSVLGKLTDEVIMPSDFSVGAGQNVLSVFFRTEQAVAANGSVWVDAPNFFDFGAACEITGLPDTYYEKFDPGAAVLENSSFTLPLPFAGPAACSGEKASAAALTLNRAKIRLSAGMLSWVRYGFRLRVANAEAYHPAEHHRWYIWTESEAGWLVDGSPHSVPSPEETWGLYDYSVGPSHFQVYIPDTSPSEQSTQITVFPVVLLVDTATILRITAPAGYQWNFTDDDFIYQAQRSDLPLGSYVPGAEADMPLAEAPPAPSSAPWNVLGIEDATSTYRRLVKYGFIARIILPSHTPTGSLNTFVLQVEGPSGRYQAGSVDAPPVQRVVDTMATLASNAVSHTGLLALHFRTVTSVPAHGGIIAVGPPGFQGSSSTCSLIMTLPNVALPPYTCTFVADASASTVTLKVDAPLPVGPCELRMVVENPSLPTTVSWLITTYESLDMMTVLDYTGVAPGFPVSVAMTEARLVNGRFCTYESLSSCAVEDRQYQLTGRNDRPGERNSLIFSFSLPTDSTEGSFVIRAPTGFEWAVQCSVAYAEVFGVGIALPSNFTAWPANVTVSQCVGNGNVVSFQVEHPLDQGFQASKPYAFRIDWVVNPMQLPLDSTWTMQFNSQASLPFAGFELWSLRDTSLVPRDFMEGITNMVMIVFSLHNAVPAQGYLHIQAPAGFLVPLQCELTISSEAVDSPLLASDYICEGVTEVLGGVATPTNEAKVHILSKGLDAGVAYTMWLSVQNPLSATQRGDSWSVKTFRKLTWIVATDTYELLDSSLLEGFRIHAKLGDFRLDNVPPKNSMADVDWEFTIQFQEWVYATDLVRFQAPSGYNVQADGHFECSRHSLLLGALAESSTACTSPCYREATCVNNSMTWRLHSCLGFQDTHGEPNGGCLPPASTLRFKLGARNPMLTPSLNSFSLEHSNLDGFVLSSGTHAAYMIVPLLTSVSIEPHSMSAQGHKAEAVGSESTLRINFTATSPALTVKISGAVNGSSFRFSAAQAYNSNTGAALQVHSRDVKFIIFSMGQVFGAGSTVSVTLVNMQNAEASGLSTWNITTYDTYNKVMGPMGIADQVLDAPGSTVVGFISVFTSSTLEPKYYGSTGAALSLDFHSTVVIPAGEEVLITAPENYAFKSEFVRYKSQVYPVNVSLQTNMAEFQGTYVRGAHTADGPLFARVAGGQYLYWHEATWRWTVSPVAGRAASGLLGEAVFVVDGSPGDEQPSFTDAQGSWEVGIGNGWLPATEMHAFMDGRLALGGRQLVVTFSDDLPAGVDVQIMSSVSLPTAGQQARQWTLEARDSSDGTLHATNDAQFLGFTLLWRVPFSLVPAQHAPRARSVLVLVFDQPRRIQGLSGAFPTTVRFELMAPASFHFPSKCFSEAESQKTGRLFFQCTGSSNSASLVTQEPHTIWGSGLSVGLAVDLPLVTPVKNEWTLMYFLDSSTVRSGHGVASGFEIVPMVASFEGNNQMGMESFGYFTFLTSTRITAGWEIRLTPPESVKYEVSCWSVRAGTLPKTPTCSKLLTTETVVLVMPQGVDLAAQTQHTVGVRVKNPTSFVPDSMNLWSIVLMDSVGNIQDSDWAVQGHRLRTLKVTAPEELTLIRRGQDDFMVAIAVDFGHDMPAGMLAKLHIVPPEAFSISGHKMPLGLPVDPLPTVQNRTLVVPLSAGTLVHMGKYVLEVVGTQEAAGLGGSDGLWAGVWLLQVFRSDGESSYQQAMSASTGM